ncbi:MAG: sulfotransferase [Bacteroidia bacterium]|nr:sulfotransferase [Bacteroidia bacterium]
MAEKPLFTGPLFISGMPRSGTKLLRDLVNNHSKISIPTHESHLIPWMIRKFGIDYDLNKPAHLEQAVAAFRTTKFFGNYPDKASQVTAENIRKKYPNKLTWAGFFEYLFRLMAPEKSGNFVWGDKTPGYILHYDLLKQIFPAAKFVHIIRDPRDYALSVQNAWGRSLYRAAHRWNETMRAVRNKGQKKNEYLEVRYEDLLENPAVVLSQICVFAGLTYEQGMERLSRVTENLGEAKGQTTILSGNKNKFLERIPKNKLLRIEELVCTEAEKLSYKMVNRVHYKPLTKKEMFMLKIQDGISSARFHMGERGITKGMQYFLKLHREGSWRQVETS